MEEQYAAQRQSIGEPDLFRLQYRDNIRNVILEIVAQALPQSEASLLIKTGALHLPDKDQAKFIQTVETELINLHEGNIARYLIRPSQYKQWKQIWEY